MNFGCGEDKDRIWRWLLKAFEERVKGRDAQHVHLIDDIYLVAIPWWRKCLKGVHQIAHVIDAVMRGSVDLSHGHARTGGDLVTALTFKTRLG